MIEYPYVWRVRWRTVASYAPGLPGKVPWFGDGVDRTGQRCRVVVRTNAMNSALIEFEDGYRVVTGRTGLRRAA